MSATLQVEKFSDFFNGCPLFAIPGRTFPVQTIYVPDAKRISALQSSFVDLAIDTTWHIHTTHHDDDDGEGGILVFLTGQHDIERACKMLKEKANSTKHSRHRLPHLDIYPLYASLETWNQKAVFTSAPPGTRKVVFATNVAQTSVTIPGIRYVVDAGFVKEKSHDTTTGMDALLVTEISQATAIQRGGRAGRTGPGKVYRLYKEESFEAMRVNSVPEIQRSSLLSTVLGLKKRGIIDVLHFPFLDPPDATLVKTALKHLYLLGAIDDVGRLTPLGDQMSGFPLSPFLSRVLVASAVTFGCSYEVVTIASLLAGEMDLFKTPSLRDRSGARLSQEDMDMARVEAEECKLRFAHHSGDHLTYLNVWNNWRRYKKDRSKQRKWCNENYIHGKVLETALRVREQLIQVMEKLDLPITHGPRVKSQQKRRHKRKDTDKGDGDGDSSNKDNSDTDDEVDAVPILKSFLTGYFSNIANKGTHRHVFSHYSPDKHFLMDGGESLVDQQYYDDGISSNSHTSGSLMALHLHPLCSFSDMLDQHKIRYRDLDWVMYMHVTYTSKAVMSGVSKIVWDWVKTSDGLTRLQRLPKTRLNGEDRPDVEEMETEKVAPEVDENAINQVKAAATDKQKRRAEEIEQIRQRALSRRRLQ
ncbi:unnamed protein product [Absidia cylindrospora]